MNEKFEHHQEEIQDTTENDDFYEEKVDEEYTKEKIKQYELLPITDSLEGFDKKLINAGIPYGTRLLEKNGLYAYIIDDSRQNYKLGRVWINSDNNGNYMNDVPVEDVRLINPDDMPPSLDNSDPVLKQCAEFKIGKSKLTRLERSEDTLPIRYYYSQNIHRARPRGQYSEHLFTDGKVLASEPNKEYTYPYESINEESVSDASFALLIRETVQANGKLRTDITKFGVWPGFDPKKMRDYIEKIIGSNSDIMKLFNPEKY